MHSSRAFGDVIRFQENTIKHSEKHNLITTMLLLISQNRSSNPVGPPGRANTAERVGLGKALDYSFHQNDLHRLFDIFDVFFS